MCNPFMRSDMVLSSRDMLCFSPWCLRNLSCLFTIFGVSLLGRDLAEACGPVLCIFTMACLEGPSSRLAGNVGYCGNFAAYCVLAACTKLAKKSGHPPSS